MMVWSHVLMALIFGSSEILASTPLQNFMICRGAAAGEFAEAVGRYEGEKITNVLIWRYKGFGQVQLLKQPEIIPVDGEFYIHLLEGRGWENFYFRVSSQDRSHSKRHLPSRIIYDSDHDEISYNKTASCHLVAYNYDLAYIEKKFAQGKAPWVE